MGIVLSHGYFLSDDEKEQAIMRPYPPLGLLYVSAYLTQHGIKNDVFDSTFSSKDELRKFLMKTKPRIVALYSNLMTKVNIVEIVKFVKSVDELKETKVILGGPDIRYNQENYLRSGADFLVIGEGEQTTLELIEAILNSENDYSNIDGIAYHNDGNVFSTGERQKLKEVDALPNPAREAIDLSKYLEAWKIHHGHSAVNISTQRGCPYTCRWCSTAVYGQSYRRRSPKKVVEEMKYILDRYNPDTLWFVDDVFTVSHKWLAAFNEELEKEKIKIPFECITRADRLNHEILKNLKDSGCFRVWIGAESGSQRIIDAMDRRVKVEKVREMIQSAKTLGIETGTFIMVGYPGEDEYDIEDTIDHLIKSAPDHFTITVAYPIKGTKLYEEVEAHIVDNGNWNTTTDREIVFQRPFSKKYYDYAVRRVVNEVNYHKYKTAGYKVKSIASKIGMWWEKAKA